MKVESGDPMKLTPPTNLYEAQRKTPIQVSSIPKIGLLENIGIRVGTNMMVKNRYAFGGPVLLLVEGAYSVAIGKDIAQQIAVKEVIL